MEVKMVAKKGRGRPKPDKVYYAPSEGARRRMQQALHKYDDVVSAIERKWGIDRLVWLVPVELRDRFEQQMDRLNAAIERQHDVEHEVEVTLRGVAAIEKAAIDAGAKPLTGEYVEGRMPDGKVLAIVPTGYEVSKVQQENRDMRVYSVDEVGRIISAWQASELVDKVKQTFSGAVVEKVKTTTETILNDEIPF
jgi:hypothetical protein